LGRGFFLGKWGGIWKEIVSSCLLLTGRHPEEMDISLTSLLEILSIAREITDEELSL